MKRDRYNIIIIICALLCLPIAIVQWCFYISFRKNESKSTRNRLEKSLLIGLNLIFFEILIICFLFFQYGRDLIHVMGTFY